MARTILQSFTLRSSTDTRSVRRTSGFVQVVGLYRKRAGEMVYGSKAKPHAGSLSIQPLEGSRSCLAADAAAMGFESLFCRLRA